MEPAAISEFHPDAASGQFAAGGETVRRTGSDRPEHLPGTAGAAEDVAHRGGVGEGLIHPEYKNGAEHKDHGRQADTEFSNFHQKSSPGFDFFKGYAKHSYNTTNSRNIQDFLSIPGEFREKKQSGLPKPVLQCIFYEMEPSDMIQLQTTGLLYR